MEIFPRHKLNRIPSTQYLLKAQSLKPIASNFSRSSTILASCRLDQQVLSEDQSQKFLTKNIQPSTISGLVKQYSTAPDHKAHDHVNIWRLERLLSVALLPLIPAALAFPCQPLDTLCAVLIVMHTHWGLEAIIVDYIRPILFGDLAPKIGIGMLYVFSIVVLAGLLNLIYNDSGLANAFLRIWKL